MEFNVNEAKTKFSKLIKLLIEHKQDVIYVTKNGKPVIQMTLVPQKNKLIGGGKGVLHDLDFDEFQSVDEEITKNFNGDLV